jgi:hypothetical protein
VTSGPCAGLQSLGFAGGASRVERTVRSAHDVPAVADQGLGQRAATDLADRLTSLRRHHRLRRWGGLVAASGLPVGGFASPSFGLFVLATGLVGVPAHARHMVVQSLIHRVREHHPVGVQAEVGERDAFTSDRIAGARRMVQPVEPQVLRPPLWAPRVGLPEPGLGHAFAVAERPGRDALGEQHVRDEGIPTLL